jgi:flagellar biosynthesis/type III secretory pathway protein FliH
MGNKSIPEEVTTAMELAGAAGWKVSNRNKKVVITPPDGVNLTIGHGPNDESMKVFRSNCRRYNLVGQGPARTPDQTDRLHQEVAEQSQQEADRLNSQRKAYEKEQQAKQRQIEAARQKAAAAIQQGMTKPEENPTMPKTTVAIPVYIPPFDPTLLGTRDNTKFLLGDGMYYCIECWQHEERNTFKAPQGLAAHRGMRHQMYPGNNPFQETNRVQLPADVDTAMDMLRVAVSDALGGGGSTELVAKEAEVEALRTKLAETEDLLKKAAKQSEQDRSAADKRFLEAQDSADKRVKDAQDESADKNRAEVEMLTQQFMVLLVEIQKILEGSTPVQAVGKIDETVRSFLS